MKSRPAFRQRRWLLAGVLFAVHASAGLFPAVHAQSPPQTDSAQTDSAQTDSAQRDSAQTDPAQTGPTEPNAASPETASGERTPRDQRTLEYWASQLSHERYLRRQSAQRHLIEGGLEAVPILLEKLDGAELETVQNVMSILAKIGIDEEPWRTDGAVAALESIAENSFGTKATLARSTLESFVDVRSREAKAQLSEAGIFVGTDTVALGSRSSAREIARVGSDWDGRPETLAWFRWLKGVGFALVEGEAARPEVFQAIVKMPALTTIVVVDAKLSADCMKILADGPRLDAIELRYVPLDDALIDRITEMRLRNALYLMGTGTSEQRVEEMRTQMPGVEITLRRGGFLGVVCRSDPNDFCIVSDVAPESGADDAGIQPRDIIVQIEDAKIRRFEDLRRQISTHEAGDEIEIRFLRAGQLLQTKATLKKLRNQ